MQGVGSMDISGTARELQKRQRSDTTFAVGLAAEQGGFERMLGAEQPERAEKPTEHPREESAPEARPETPEGRHSSADTREDTRVPVAQTSRSEDRGEAAVTVRRPAAGAELPVTKEMIPRPGAEVEHPVTKLTMPRPTAVPPTRPVNVGEAIPRPLPAPANDTATKPIARATDPKPEPAPAVPNEPTRDAGYARLIGQQALLRPEAARPLQTDGRPIPAPAASDLPNVPSPEQTPADSLRTAEAPDLGSARAVIEPGVHETAPPPPAQPAATVAFNPLPVANAQPTPVASQVAAEAPLPDQATPEANAQLSQQVRSQVLTQLTGQLGGLGGKGSLRLSLSPPELGRVDIRFTRDAGRLQLTFRVESAVAARALQDGTGQLQELLLGNNSNWQQVEITVEREGEDPAKKNPSEQRGRSRRDDERREAQDREEQGGEA